MTETINWLLSNAVLPFVTFAGTLGIIFMLTDFRCSKRVVMTVWFAISAGGAAVGTVIKLAFGYWVAELIFVPVVIIPTLAFYFAKAKRNIFLFIFNFFTVVNVLFLAVILEMILAGADTPAWASILVRTVVFALAIFAFGRYLRDAYLYLARNAKKTWRVISFIPLMCWALVVLAGTFPEVREENLPIVVLLYGMMAVVYYVIYKVFKTTYENLQSQMPRVDKEVIRKPSKQALRR